MTSTLDYCDLVGVYLHLDILTQHTMDQTTIIRSYLSQGQIDGTPSDNNSTLLIRLQEFFLSKRSELNDQHMITDTMVID